MYPTGSICRLIVSSRQRNQHPVGHFFDVAFKASILTGRVFRPTEFALKTDVLTINRVVK